MQQDVAFFRKLSLDDSVKKKKKKSIVKSSYVLYVCVRVFFLQEKNVKPKESVAVLSIFLESICFCWLKSKKKKKLTDWESHTIKTLKEGEEPTHIVSSEWFSYLIISTKNWASDFPIMDSWLLREKKEINLAKKIKVSLNHLGMELSSVPCILLDKTKPK